jgi:outer membrane protein assembly factor BamB
MSDLRSVIEREIGRVEPLPYPYEAFQDRRLRAARRRRAAATGLGLLVGIALVVSMMLVLRGREGGAPATPPITPKSVSGLRRFWSGDTGGTIHSSPVVAGNRVYVTNRSGTLLAFPITCGTAPGTCRPIWTANEGPHSTFDIGSPAVGDGMVFVGSRQGHLYGYPISCSPGECQPTWTADPGGDLSTASPVVADGVVYVGSRDGTLFAYDTGCATYPHPCAPLWTAPLKRGFGADGYAGAQPVVAGDVVFVGSTHGLLYAFPTSCRTPCRPLREVQLHGVLNNPLVVRGGTLFVTAGRRLYAYPTACFARGCGPDWVGNARGLIIGTPAVGAGHVYVGTDHGVVAAFDPCGRGRQACFPAWSIPELGVLPNPTFDDGVLFTSSSFDMNYLLAFDPDCGRSGATCTPLWRERSPDYAVFEQQTASDGRGTLFAVTGLGVGTTAGGWLYAYRVRASAPSSAGGQPTGPGFDLVTSLTLVLLAGVLILLWRRRVARRLPA